MTAPDEFGLIARWFAPLAAGEPGAFGLLDDAAALTVPGGRELVVTCDMLVAGVHFFDDDPADSIGCKVLAVNLSDLAAKGAEPRAYLLSIALPGAWGAARLESFLDGFAGGLAAVQEEWGLHLVGGDTVSTTGPLTVSVTAIGLAPAGRIVRRAGARPGDTVWVSGHIGCATLGLRVLQGRITLDPALAADVVDRYRWPRPRLALGRRLAGHAHACADVSDGLAADLGHICRASGVTATIEAGRVPLSPAGRAALAADPGMTVALLTGGDDYELVFTAAPEDEAGIRAAEAAAGVAVTPIGVVHGAGPATLDGGADGGPVRVLDAQGCLLDVGPGGWRHL